MKDDPKCLTVRGSAPIVLLALVAALTAPLGANPEITVDLPGGATMDFVWIEPETWAEVKLRAQGQ